MPVSHCARTWLVQLAELPLASTTVQLTVVVPMGRAVPEVGLHITATAVPELS
jgi:hypothetical protein